LSYAPTLRLHVEGQTKIIASRLRYANVSFSSRECASVSAAFGADDVFGAIFRLRAIVQGRAEMQALRRQLRCS